MVLSYTLNDMRRIQFSRDSRNFIGVTVSLAIGFAMLLVLVILLARMAVDMEHMRGRSKAEQAFNTVWMAFQQGGIDNARQVMFEENIAGVGVYSSTGQGINSIGTAPFYIDLSSFPHGQDEDLATGLTSYSRSTGMVEYVRYARLSLLFDSTDGIPVAAGESFPIPLGFPDVLYIEMDGSAVHRRITVIGFLSTIVIIVLVLLFLLVYRIYLRNREYRVRLSQQESLVSLGQAARTLTHEIKNPLSAITLQLAILKKTLPAERRDDLAVLAKEVKRVVDLTDKVSDFLRNPVGTPVPVVLPDLFTSLAGTFGRKIPMEVEGSGKILMDEDRARSVFENLLKNAFESCADGRDPQVSVRIFSDRKDRVHVLVRDRGDGITPEAQKKMFNPFFTTKIHGSGIGLSISRQFVRARGGTLKLRPRDGGGTVVEVILPGLAGEEER